MDRPNILLIMTDQQRWDSLGCYGSEAIDTPNLDRLASRGAKFTNCYVNNPICTPSRASILTGKRISRHGVCRLHDNLPLDEVMFPEYLRRSGYQTALFGKLHVSGRLSEEAVRHPYDGYDVYEWCLEASISLDSPLNGYAAWLKEKNLSFFHELREKGRKLLHIPREYHFTHWASERTKDYIRNRDTTRPFFCKMSVFDPHNPYEDYPIEYAQRVRMEKLPPIISIQDESGAYTSDKIAAVDRERRESYFGNGYGISSEDRDKIRLGYYASLALLDDEVGEVLDVLDEQGIADDTLVIFVSDHGDMIGDHDLYVKGIPSCDPVVKVPFLVSWPGRIPGGNIIDALVQPSDIFSLCMNAAGIEDDQQRDSRNLLPVLEGLCDSVHDEVVCEYRNSGINQSGGYWDPPMHGTMIRDETYKLTVYHEIPGISDAQMQLFHMLDDPQELRNLAYSDDHQDILRSMLLKLASWFVQGEMQEAGRGGEMIPKESDRIVNLYK